MTARSFESGSIAAGFLSWSGWVVSNILIAAGLLVVIFAAIGGGSMMGLMLQLQNLADRYVVADLTRQSQFNMIVLVSFAVLFCGAAFFRRHAAPIYRKGHLNER